MINQDKLYNEFLARQKIYENLHRKQRKAKKIFDELELKLEQIKEEHEKAEEIFDDLYCDALCAEEEMRNAEDRFDEYNKEGCISDNIYPYIHNPIGDCHVQEPNN